MINTLIIDDEKHCIDRIEGLLRTCGSEFQLTAKAQTVEEAISETKKHHPDLVFLDVQIGTQTGFDYLAQWDQPDFDVVFTTAYDQYAIEAFKFSALDYLLKPIDKENFKVAINKYTSRLSKNYFDKKMEVLMHNLRSNQATKKISIPTQEGYEFLTLQEVLRLEADGNYTHIFHKNGTKLTVAKTLKVFDEMLVGSNFFRIHHSHLINLIHIKKYYKGKGGYVVMEDGASVDVSTRKKEEFLKFLTNYYH
ncbi:LytTR family DNA-binding domain-containing protein [Gramella sp. AN32]|uniref:LytR/AlgR family response regulator transcription factor n=1 Tax=Christiangramia antarctica TaxID=2058158 RepID=A0ABW5X4A3_9FLAO|nr:LytTR family DNA-binding domain-containing protein [Gramella sp. AN32]MCM4156302.1 DNA-binding response regulator [Gramella sp. AN32]